MIIEIIAGLARIPPPKLTIFTTMEDRIRQIPPKDQD